MVFAGELGLASGLTSDKYYFTVYADDQELSAPGSETALRTGRRSGIRPDTVERILTVLNAATTPQALDIPRYRLHPLKGDLKGWWSVTVRANWRIIFRFEGTDAFDVELIDYH
jgi:proteic killer suppression protein